MRRLLPLVGACALGGLAAAFVLAPASDERHPVVEPEVVAPAAAPVARAGPSPVYGAVLVDVPDPALLDLGDPTQAREARRALADAMAREAFEARLEAIEASAPPEIAARVRAATVGAE